MNSFLETSISPDLGLKIIQYLNVIDSGRLAEVSQRYYYLVHQYRRLRGPELVTVRSDGRDLQDMVDDMKQKTQSQPNLVLHFCAVGDILPACSFADKTVTLGVMSPQEIQVFRDNEGDFELNSSEKNAIMAMNFPGAKVLPFSIEGDPSALDFDFLERRLKYHNKSGDDKYWKGLILYANGGATEEVITRMQKFMPNAVIVGGVCATGHVSIPQFEKEELASMSIKHLRYLSNLYIPPNHVNPRRIVEKSDLVNQLFEKLQKYPTFVAARPDTVFGVILGGDVPIRSVVSRGVHSILNNNGPPRSFSDLVVHETEFVKPGMEGYLFNDEGPPVHYITKIKDKTDGKLYEPMQVFNRISMDSSPQFLGLKRKECDGFELSEMNNLITHLNFFVVISDGSESSEESLLGAEMDFFALSGKACMEDMDRTMLMLREQTQNEEILGAVMYTCCARGPTPSGLIPERMSDALRFAKVFPDVPCLGFYANGEFGPMALAGNENVFQSGKSAHQGVSRDSKPKHDLLQGKISNSIFFSIAII